MTLEEYKNLPKWKGKIFMKDEETCFNDGFEAGAKENGVQLHDLQKNPEDLPQCAENKRILFYVKEWLENLQYYYNNYCLGFYKNAFLHDAKVFVEKSKGYENEHLPQTVLFWAELPQFTGE